MTLWSGTGGQYQCTRQRMFSPVSLINGHGMLVTLTVLSHVAHATCPDKSAASQQNIGGCDHVQIETMVYADCESACCDDIHCLSWNWDSNLTAAKRPSSCPNLGVGCCWLKSCPGNPGSPCGGDPYCVSWSGRSGRKPPPPPLPPTPPPCPEGERCFRNSGTRAGVTKSYDCEVRTHAYNFAKATLPERGGFQSAFDALQLDACGVPRPSSPDMYKPPVFPEPEGVAIYCDANAGPAGNGSAGAPYSSLEAAIMAASAIKGPKKILMEAGTYYTKGVVLTADHSDLTIQNKEGADVVISGAIPVLSSVEKWSIYNRITNTWVLDTTGQKIDTEFGMRVGTRRAIRAKYPNGDPETAAEYCEIPLGSIASPGVYINGSGVDENYPQYFPREHENVSLTKEYWAYPSDWPSVFWHPSDEIHPMAIGGYGPYFYAQGGVCSGRIPNHGYWCAENPRGLVGQHLIDPPGGFLYGDVLPQAKEYKNPKGAIIHARGGSMPYFAYQCLIDRVENGSVYFDPAIGCDQGGPTPQQPGKAWDWFIENVLEECDSPGEYFYDLESERLYYTFNHTDNPSGNEEFSLTRTKVIFNISGTMENPVRNVRIQGVTIRDAAFTYLGTTEADIHWLPSEGDWALQRSGAITMEGVENITILKNQFTRCDGNGIFLGGYTRNVSLISNDFNFIGDSAMAAFGWTSDCLNENCSIRLPAKVGPDGRGGEQPRHTYIAGNLVREIGIWQKQSSAWFQALAAFTTIESNVFFNGPRAAVNLNDAFGGGDILKGNLMFNMVRETVDHGTLNAWERGPYFSELGYIEDNSSNLRPTATELAAGATPGFKVDRSGKGSVVGQYRTLSHNFLLGTYNVNSNLETDDGSSRYLQYNNYFVYSTSATDFAMNAHWNYYVNNVHAYGETVLRGWGPAAAATNCYVYNSTFYMLGDSPLCGGQYKGSVWDTSVVYSNSTKGIQCPFAATAAVTMKSPALDNEVTAAAMEVLKPYPRPYNYN